MIVVTACFRPETAWIKGSPGLRVVRLPLGAPSGLERILEEDEPPKLVVSTGFCGGLDPKLRTGDLILATEIRHHKVTIKVDQRLLARARKALKAQGLPFAEGRLLTSEQVIQTPDEKKSLYNEESLGVEMEAGKVASWAKDRGIGFLAIKAVLDPATRSLPFSGTAGWNLLRHPLAMLRTGWEAIIAGRAIGRGVGSLVQAFAGGVG